MCLHHKAAQDHIYFRYNGRSIHPNEQCNGTQQNLSQIRKKTKYLEFIRGQDMKKSADALLSGSELSEQTDFCCRHIEMSEITRKKK